MADAFKDILFPPHCPLCTEAVNKHNLELCGKCASAFGAYRIKGPLCTICGIPFKDAASEDHTCGNCIRKTPAFFRARSLYYFKGEVREAVHCLKYKWGTMLGSYLGWIMAAAVTELAVTPDIIAAVPLHRKKITFRGFNQSVLLARHMSKVLSVKLDISNLQRIRATPSQVGLRGTERSANVAGAFMVRETGLFNGKDVVLVDDVFTTGATVGECALVLKRAGARVTVITLARAVS